ncbi:organic anion transporter-like protein [Dinothrombium tinctorium]|uniref:Organic anion transporter-like protein n=1 Tax=Dinothrombium tinctorium TaxID=1965070 RepID=A0A3S3PEX0_9ACAR|nr:organic anion transporter-like protein [Dinothrombium tinctorium]RWS12899.1 organic anion transporter-like protein [Dinothrombium tinctorium]RWS13862.1 organic anion transporter-like protein [Dinothrombium tinctorium]
MLSPLDFVLLQLGSPGRYQLFIGFLLCCLQLPLSFSNDLWTYYAEEPPHRCLITREKINGTRESEWIPIEESNKFGKRFSSCSMYIDVLHHWKGTQNCVDGWEYKPYEKEHNIIMEWNLVCERKYLLTILFYTSHLFAIFGSLVFSSLSDRFERKRMLLLSLYLFVSVALSIHFVQDFATFAILYCLQMFFAAVRIYLIKFQTVCNSFSKQGILLISYVLLIELYPTPFQVQASLYLTIFAIISTTFFPLIVWVIRTWRYVQLALVAPGIVFFTHLWILPQSPLWLINEGRIHIAENLIENLAAQNGKSISPSFRLHLQNIYNSLKGLNETRHRFLPKFSSPCIRWYLLVHFYLHFVTSLTLNVTESQVLRLHESKYVDHFFRGLVDLGTIMILYYFAVRLGPRPAQSLVFILSGLLMMGAISLQEMLPKTEDISDEFDYRLLLLPSMLVSGGRTLLRTLPAFIWYHTVKTLPTGAELIAPFVPIGLCGSLAVIAGALSLLFPNCWRKPLPNTVEEAENRKLIPIKERYPSFRELKNKKLSSLTQNPVTQSNVYTVDPVVEKTSVKCKEMLCAQRDENCNQRQAPNQTQQSEMVNASVRPLGLYDAADSKLSDLEEEYNRGNWRLYPNEINSQQMYKVVTTNREVNRSLSDMHEFNRIPEARLTRVVPHTTTKSRDTLIAETHL